MAGIFGNVIQNVAQNWDSIPIIEAAQELFQPTGSRFTGFTEQPQEQPVEQPQEWQAPLPQPAEQPFFADYFGGGEEEQPFSKPQKSEQQSKSENEGNAPGTQDQNKSWLEVLMDNVLNPESQGEPVSSGGGSFGYTPEAFNEAIANAENDEDISRATHQFWRDESKNLGEAASMANPVDLPINLGGKGLPVALGEKGFSLIPTKSWDDYANAYRDFMEVNTPPVEGLVGDFGSGSMTSRMIDDVVNNPGFDQLAAINQKQFENLFGDTAKNLADGVTPNTKILPENRVIPDASVKPLAEAAEIGSGLDARKYSTMKDVAKAIEENTGEDVSKGLFRQAARNNLKAFIPAAAAGAGIAAIADPEVRPEIAETLTEKIDDGNGGNSNSSSDEAQMDRFLKFIEDNPEWVNTYGLTLDERNPYTSFRVNGTDDAWWDLVGGANANVLGDYFRNDASYGDVNWDAEDARDQFINALNANALNAYLYFTGANGYNGGFKPGASSGSISDLAEYAMNNWNGAYMLSNADVENLRKMGLADVANNVLNNKDDLAYITALNSIANTGSLGGLSVDDLNALAQAAGETGSFGRGEGYQTGEQSGRTNAKNTQNMPYYNDVFKGNSQTYPLWQTPQGDYIPANAVDLILAADPTLGFKEG